MLVQKFDKEQVTVNMIAESLAIDFPEFAFAYAEENFLRGYQLGLEDARKTTYRTDRDNFWNSRLIFIHQPGCMYFLKNQLKIKILMLKK